MLQKQSYSRKLESSARAASGGGGLGFRGFRAYSIGCKMERKNTDWSLIRGRTSLGSKRTMGRMTTVV